MKGRGTPLFQKKKRWREMLKTGIRKKSSGSKGGQKKTKKQKKREN